MTIGLILKISLLISLCCIGIYNASLDGMILSRPRLLFEKYFNKYIHKPLITCYICMASVYSVLFFSAYILINNLQLHNIIYLIFIIPAVSALNVIIYEFVGFLKG